MNADPPACYGVASRRRSRTRPRRKHKDTKTRRPLIPPTHTKRRSLSLIDGCVAWRQNDRRSGIACRRCEGRLLRTRTFVAVHLLTGRRARGASVPPLFRVVVVGDRLLSTIECKREVASPALAKRRTAGPGNRGGSSLLQRLTGPAVTCRHLAASTSPHGGIQRKPLCASSFSGGWVEIWVYLCDLWAFFGRGNFRSS